MGQKRTAGGFFWRSVDDHARDLITRTLSAARSKREAAAFLEVSVPFLIATIRRLGIQWEPPAPIPRQRRARVDPNKIPLPGVSRARPNPPDEDES